MPRRPKPDTPSYFHVLNRAVRRLPLFEKPKDYSAFLKAVAYAQGRCPVPLLSYCLMPNHFHLVVGPVLIDDLSRFMHLMTVVHAMRWHAHRRSSGTGHVYQGRFKSLVIDNELHLLNVCCYVERNPVRANLVARAEAWPWSSLNEDCRNRNLICMAPWPIPKPSSWLAIVNQETRTPKSPGLLP